MPALGAGRASVAEEARLDPLTQGLLGATFGQALCGRRLGRAAPAWGALIGVAPDVDVLLRFASPMAEWLWHRGPTHALWCGPLLGPAIGWLLWKKKGGRLADWTLLAVVALVTHPLLDAFTSYGTQLLSPFSNHRFASDAVAIIDPAYTLVLAAAVLFGLRRGMESRASRVAAWAAIVVSSAYLGLGLAANRRAEGTARAELAASGVPVERVSASPTMFQLPLRRIVARSGPEVRIGWLSVTSSRPIVWERFVSAQGPLVDSARATREGRILEWFAKGETAARVIVSDEGSTVEIDDLRYGLPGSPRDGLWGVRVRFDPAGRPLGPGERFDRPVRARAREVLDLLWRETLGLG